MGTYKVIQDIEADDKLLGPLTLRQFIYAIIVVVSLFTIFKLATEANPLLAIPLLPHTILFAMLASPIGKDQSPEVWLLAKIRFQLKPRKRIWNQNGLKELVTITAPKKIEKILTDNLTQDEVRSRLEALANTIDSRGWSVKNVDINMFSQPSYVLNQVGSDRLIDVSTMAQDVPADLVGARDDMLDEQNNPKAQTLDQMISATSQTHKQQAIQNMKNPAQAAQSDYWFLNQSQAQVQPGYATFGQTPVIPPGSNTPAGPAVDDPALLNEIQNAQKPHIANSHLRNIKPLSEQDAEPVTVPEVPIVAKNPVVQEMAGNDDLDVATIARQVNKKPPEDEVVINLH